ncbi:hypothetical protein [Sphingomonas elodea]|uniref:hypothetical protein n=1 Tax=Sphingomonas elodea TaxID=179878 RepID=UPI001ED91BA3|nr:hypothetical protein [Sphingomonas elodea]
MPLASGGCGANAMDDSGESLFSVAAANEAAAVEYVTERGFPPLRVERDEKGCSVLVFAPLPDTEMFRLANALPVHLSAKVGFVGGAMFE